MLFHIGSFPIHTFGLLVGIGFVLGLWTSARRASTVGIHADAIFDLGPSMLFGGLIGARIWYVASYWERDFAGRPLVEAFRIWNGGLVFYGGLLAGAAFTIGRILWQRLPLWRVADCLAPGIALGHVLGRLGCFMNGCCYGRSSTVPWAVSFPSDRPGDAGPVHPTQLYEAGLNLLLSAGLSWLFRRRRFDGQVFSVYLLGYAGVRFATEWFRGDYDRHSEPLSGMLTPGQVVSVPLMAAGLVLYARLRRRPPAPRGGDAATLAIAGKSPREGSGSVGHATD